MEVFKGIIYKATSVTSKKSYIGKTIKKLEIRRNEHIRSINKSKDFLFSRALKKYSYHDFHWEVIDRSAKNLKELGLLEIKYIKELKTKLPFGYNMTDGGPGGVTNIKKGDNKFNNPSVAKVSNALKGRTKETHQYLKENGEKISLSRKGKNKDNCEYLARTSKTLSGRTKETHPYLAAVSEKMKGKTLSEETKKLISLKQLGKVLSDETKEKMSQAAMGREVSDDTKAKLRIANQGKKASPETKEKMRIARIGKPGPNLGRKMPEEQRKKMIGRTKETHPYLARSWKGQTKETCEWIKKAAEKRKGRNKENHEGIRRQAEKVRGRKKAPETLEKMRKASTGQNNPMSKTNIEKRKFKKEYPELFSFEFNIPPILPVEYQRNDN